MYSLFNFLQETPPKMESLVRLAPLQKVFLSTKGLTAPNVCSPSFDTQGILHKMEDSLQISSSAVCRVSKLVYCG